MSMRRGFTVMELIIVLSALGILTTLAVPRFRQSMALAEGAALSERVYSVRLAYEEAGSPDAEALVSAEGTVPAGLAPVLNERHFAGEGGVLLRIVGKGRKVFVALRAPDARGQQTRWYFHMLSKNQHLHGNVVTLVPLSDAAIASIPVTLATRPAGAQAAKPQTSVARPDTPKPPADTAPVVPPVQQPSQVPVTQPPQATQLPAVTQQPVTQQPPVVQQPVVVQQPPAQSTPTCSSNLPPGQYKNCVNGGTPHGWFHNHH